MHATHVRRFLPKRFAAAHGLPAAAAHDVHVYSANAAASKREDIADELARSYAREARHTARDKAAATQMLLLANR